MICFDTHFVLKARRLKMAKFVTFVAPILFHVTSFDSNIGWFSSLVATFVSSSTFHLSFVMISWPKPLASFDSHSFVVGAT